MFKANHIKWNPDDGAAENARKRLPKLARAYFAEVRKVLSENPKPAELHRLRLASKHFRYTLELFRPCYAAGLEQRLALLKQVQDVLGECNDAVSAQPVIGRLLRGSPEKPETLRKMQSLAEAKAKTFRDYWTKEFDAPGKEEWWAGYLARGARPPAKGK
jgi:CHAD domain-containing protein